MSKELKQIPTGLRIKITIYKASTVSVDGFHMVENKDKISLQYGIPEWKSFLKSIREMGYLKVDFNAAYIPDGLDSDNFPKYKKYDNPEVINLIMDELNEAIDNKFDTLLTPDQKKIKELEAKLELLAQSNNAESATPKRGRKPKTTNAETEK